jgi:hypothetical protein
MARLIAIPIPARSTCGSGPARRPTAIPVSKRGRRYQGPDADHSDGLDRSAAGSFCLNLGDQRVFLVRPGRVGAIWCRFRRLAAAVVAAIIVWEGAAPEPPLGEAGLGGACGAAPTLLPMLRRVVREILAVVGLARSAQHRAAVAAGVVGSPSVSARRSWCRTPGNVAVLFENRSRSGTWFVAC